MEIRVYDNETVQEIAYKIYQSFEIFQSCKVTGFIQDGRRMEAKGELVLKEIDRLDRLDNVRKMGEKMTRKRKKPPNTVGGYVAHKIFQWEKNIVDNEVRYTIWRIQ